MGGTTNDCENIVESTKLLTMVIAGAGGHSLEILDIVLETVDKSQIAFFDDLSDIRIVHSLFPVLKTKEKIMEWFKQDPTFCIGVGAPEQRKVIYEKITSYGGKLQGIKSVKSEMSHYASGVSSCADIFKQTFISSLTQIGYGTLINTGAKVHHETIIGDFCEVSPAAILLGRAHIGDFCRIGSGAIILANIRICSNTTIGAGAVVTKSIEKPGTYVGVPARLIK
jgi:sugar O-acyltransferase (sialic acid O-acetyltransferase NeuD family)